jgi:hypothetical protein
MKHIHLVFALLLLSAASARAQKVDYVFIKNILSQPDSVSFKTLQSSGYTVNKDGDFKYISDNRIKSFISYVKANPNGGSPAYWGFQARGKKLFKPLLKEIKKGAVVKTGTQYGKERTEYKSPDGYYFYPFEDSVFDGLYWIYASKESLLEQ